MARLSGKVALISGGARGQGAEEARLFVQEGAKVIITDVLDDEGKKLEAELNEMGGDAQYMPLDVTDENQWDSVIQRILEAHGQIDILVNNAGILLEKGVEETSEEEWDRIQDVNSKGVFLGIRAVLPAMREAGSGSIVNISSVAGLIGSAYAAYGASKGAVRLLTKSTAVQYGPEGVRCNSVHPGVIETDMTEGMLSDPRTREIRLKNTPLGTFAVAKDVAYAVLYLASDESRYVTGSELVIDGGLTAK
jgi:cyclopentanol dehydrogenase